MQHDRQPIGYWLKRLDRLIDEAFERTLGADGLTRRHWQVLNTLVGGAASGASLAAALQPFIENGANVEQVVDDLLQRNWARRLPDGTISVSDQGRAAHAALVGRVAETRQRLRRGITDDEYLQVVRVLQRMSANLESHGAV